MTSCRWMHSEQHLSDLSYLLFLCNYSDYIEVLKNLHISSDRAKILPETDICNIAIPENPI
jgi:hypothetical protein